MLLRVTLELYTVSHSKAEAGGGAPIIDCRVVAAESALKKVSSGVVCMIHWLWEKFGVVFVVIT